MKGSNITDGIRAENSEVWSSGVVCKVLFWGAGRAFIQGLFLNRFSGLKALVCNLSFIFVETLQTAASCDFSHAPRA